MTKAYSLDLREKVMAYVNSGKKKIEEMKIFNLHRRTIYRWERRLREERLAATESKIQNPKKLYPEELREYIKNNPVKTLKEIGAAFRANDASALYRIRQLGITYKKTYYTRSRTKKSGEHSRNSSIKSK
ncbi:MAG: transposase [Puniceicoccales bacterium]|jgi:transposase|nr:transposase [Puniceicoccales bacterium]